jgi:hypothetical protein
MTERLLQSVVHPTDFSPAGLDAFAHALRLAVAAKSHFYILHIAGETEQADWVQFPRVRETLAAWGMIAPDAPQSAVASELGLRVEKAIIESDDPVRGVEAFVERASLRFAGADDPCAKRAAALAPGVGRRGSGPPGARADIVSARGSKRFR